MTTGSAVLWFLAATSPVGSIVTVKAVEPQIINALASAANAKAQLDAGVCEDSRLEQKRASLNSRYAMQQARWFPVLRDAFEKRARAFPLITSSDQERCPDLSRQNEAASAMNAALVVLELSGN